MSFGDWLDERVGHRRVFREALDEPVTGGASIAYVWGSALTLSLVVQLVTGWLLMTAYAPSATTAWSSVMHIQHQMTAGWLVRGLHHYGAQAMVVLLVAHLGQTAIYGAYRRPREMNWLLGVGLMGLTLAFALTGYLLPWDQKGYWATKVATNIAGVVPGIGPWLQRLLVGGAEYGHLTLTRFYMLHVGLLPALTVALLVAHVMLFRKHGVTPGRHADRSRVDRFFPRQLGLDLLVGGAVLGVLFWLTYRSHGAPLDAPADPASDYPARPEWYFASLFEALKHVSGSMEWVVAVGMPALLVGYLVALPFLDKPDTPRRKRALYLAPLAAMGLGVVALTYKSLASDAADPAYQAAVARSNQNAARSIELAREGVPPAGPLAMLAADPETRGPVLFDKHCAACHRLGELGPKDGEDTAPDLTDFGTAAWARRVLIEPDDKALFGNTPFAGMMPSQVHPPKDPAAAEFFTALTPEQLDAIASFLAAEAEGAPDTRKMPGNKLVKDRCTGCHRLDGETPLDPESLGPELRGWGSVPWIAQQIADPGSGKTYPPGAMAKELEGHMPAFADQLTQQEIDLLATWVHRQSRSASR